MTTASKIVTLLIFGALFVLVIKNPSDFSQDATSGGGVLDNTLNIEAGGAYKQAA